MNAFTNAIRANAARPNLVMARTENGMRALASTANPLVDLFGSIGAMRGQNVVPAFEAAFAVNPDVAVRIAQWARDIRGGSGERQLFRDILLYLERNEPVLLIDSNLLNNVANIGRFDDLLIFSSDVVKRKAYTVIFEAIAAGNGLAAKWMPRKGPIAVELRTFMGMSPKQYRKTLVGLTSVVETAMCSGNWNEINFSHVPSVAMSNYMTAFHKRAPEQFAAYKAALVRNDGTAKVNASAVYPYDVIKMLGTSSWGRSNDNEAVANAMWEALPNYMNGQGVLPMVDVSGSMTSAVTASVTCLDVAVSLGLYCSDKTSNPAFKDLFLTFSSRPQFVSVKGSLSQKISKMVSSDWQMNTDLVAAFSEVLKVAVNANVPEADMPKILLILSDMQFDQCARYDDSALQMIRRKYEAAGYAMPAIVFWNLADRGNKPVRFNERGVALVSGFSPAIMKSILSSNLDKFSPEKVMLEAVMVDKYAW